MISSVTELRRQPGRYLRRPTVRLPRQVPLDPAQAQDRSIRRRINVVWGLLYLNTLTFVPGISILHIPSKVGKGMAQGVLPLAILLLLTLNPRLRLRPNLFLCLVGLLCLDAVITSALSLHLGTMFRTFRLVEFVVALWLLTPWWDRPDMLIFWCHLRWLCVSLGLVFFGLLVAPGHAFAYGGRLTGVFWPMLPTQIAHYAALTVGLLIILFLARLISGRVTLIGAAVSVAILLLSHTRTALAGLVVGLLVGGLSLFSVNARVRKFFAAALAAVSVGVVTVGGFVTAWLTRGESAQGLASLTGRTNFWGLVLTQPRTKFEEVFGFGLSNASVNGLPIDSNWLASYMQEGLFGVVVCTMILVWLLVVAFFQPPGIRRALALFIVTYCTVASFTEDAFTDVSTYLLDLTVVASLIVVPVVRRARATASRT